jgi:phenylacetate-CoA ligase
MPTAVAAPGHDLFERVLPGVGGIRWPPLPGPNAAAMLALQDQLARTQYLAPEALARAQFRQLAALLDHARRHSPFWEHRLAGLDLAPDTLPAGFAALPTLSRAEVQKHGDALHSRAVPPGHGALVQSATSGSTGRPIRALGTQLDQFWWAALLLREHLWHRRDLDGTLGAIRTNVDSGRRDGWGPATDGMFRTGPSVLLNAACDVERQVDWLLAEDPHYLNCHPSNLQALARACLERGVRPRRLREARSFGEMLPDGLRELIRTAWGVRLVDCYSAQELGYIALQCPEADHYHVQAEHLLVEVLDDGNRPVPPGGIGRVVVTALHGYAMPLVRYELRDYAEVGAPCACGRGLPVLARILGRARNMLHLPDGSSHWPSFPSSLWLAVPAVRQFQIVQVTRQRITLRLAADRPLTADEIACITGRLDERLRHRFTYAVEYVEPFAGGGKFEDFISLVDAAETAGAETAGAETAGAEAAGAQAAGRTTGDAATDSTGPRTHTT